MTGELISLSVAILWTLSAIFFEYAGRAIKPSQLNLIRLILAFILLGIILLAISAAPIPLFTNVKVWFWMSLSGFVGFVFGDYFLFSSYRIIPARLTQLIMTLAPPFAALSGYFILGEKLTLNALLGMVVTLTGIAISILKRGSADTDSVRASRPETHIHLEVPVKGVLFAFLAAIGQGVGLVLSKQGMEEYSLSLGSCFHDIDSNLYIPLASTQIRIITGIVCFLVIIALTRGGFKELLASFKAGKSMTAAFGGSIVGPVLGVSLSLMAVQHTNTAIASTIMAIVPILIIIPDAFIYKRKVSLVEVLGAIISVAGVSLFFI